MAQLDLRYGITKPEHDAWVDEHQRPVTQGPIPERFAGHSPFVGDWSGILEQTINASIERYTSQ